MWRVFNLVCAIPVGQAFGGVQVIEYSVQSVLLAYIEKIRHQYYSHPLITEWDWHTSRLAIDKMDINELILIYNKLKRDRFNRPGYKRELIYFLALCEERYDANQDT